MTALERLLRELDPRKPIDPSQRALLMDALREATPEGERPPRASVKRVARILGKSPQTITRWFEKGLPDGGRPIWTPDEELILELFAREGVFRQVWNLLKQRLGAENAPSVRTVERGFHAVLTPAELAYCTYGAPGYRAAMTVFTNPDGPLHRNQLWELDAVELPIKVRVKDRAQPQKVWAIFVLDCGSRAIMSYVLAVGSRPHRGHVMTALAVAIRGRHEHCPFRGLPRFVRTDNGLEFIARDVLDLIFGVGALPIPTRAWMAWHKGKIERFNWTVVQMLIRFLPGYLDGPRDAKGELLDLGEPIALELLVQELEDFIDYYNTQHQHGGLGRRTPLSVWNDDETPLKLVADEQLRFLLADGGTRTIQRQGVFFEGRYYLGDGVVGRKGEKVEIRHLPHDPRYIEVYRDGEHLCTAYPAEELTDEQRSAVEEKRQRQEKLAQQRRKKANRARRAQAERVAPITGPSEVEFIPIQTPAATRAEEGQIEEQLTRGMASTSLLGLDAEPDLKEAA